MPIFAIKPCNVFHAVVVSLLLTSARGSITGSIPAPTSRQELPCEYCVRAVRELAASEAGAAEAMWGAARLRVGAGNMSDPLVKFWDHLSATHVLLTDSSVPGELAMANVTPAVEALVQGLEPGRVCSLIGACPHCPLRDLVPDTLKADFDVVRAVTILAAEVAHRYEGALVAKRTAFVPGNNPDNDNTVLLDLSNRLQLRHGGTL